MRRGDPMRAVREAVANNGSYGIRLSSSSSRHAALLRGRVVTVATGGDKQVI